ncbi:hypothetical protein SESBI_46097 [Sesbania bispinosa]|nr:hypothetical protein SESBI_46097 [Sesbania bispinosa]
MFPNICEAYLLSDFCKDLTGIQQIQDEREVMPPNSEAAAAASAATEPLDNDRPIQCPLPEPSILNSFRGDEGNTVQAMTAQQRDGLGFAIGVYNGGLTTVLEAVREGQDGYNLHWIGDEHRTVQSQR